MGIQSVSMCEVLVRSQSRDMDTALSVSSILTSITTPGTDFVYIENDDISHCVYTSDCILDLVQHSFTAHNLCDKADPFQRSLTAGKNHDALEPLISKAIPPSIPLSPSIASTHSFSPSKTTSCTGIYDEMTTCVTQLPDSPPGLIGSKSSKNSSFHSSTSGTDTTLFDPANFEEIFIGEDDSVPYPDVHGIENSHPIFRNLSQNMIGVTNSAPTATSKKGLTNGAQRPLYLHVQTHNRVAERRPPTHSLNLLRSPNSRRGFTSPSAPSLAMTAMSNLSRSRSPSPSQTPDLALPRPAPRRLSAQLQSSSPEIKQPPVRRGSWQPSRKSVKELEDEYDDLDEDLPEEASLWNVPLSPRPGPDRTPISATNSTNVSPSTSPERSGSPHFPANSVSAASAQSSRSFSVTSPKEVVCDKINLKTPLSPSKLRYARGVSTGDIPDNFYFPKHRSKTWDVALSELSEEARILTEALEDHAEASERQQERSIQNGVPPANSNVKRLPRVKPCSVELPPLRVNNVVIDPLPVSKEKEKVLSRTRPSWLPPKDRKEEKRHLKEYQRMMELSVEADKRKATKAANAKCAQDDTKNALLRIWEEHVLPNWDQVIREPRTRELWWRGVAPRSRARVWEKALGNELALTEMTYTKALQRAKTVEIQIAQARPDERIREAAWFKAIRRDIKSVFPELRIFQPGGPLHDGLVDVLMAYSMYRSDVGYSHGTHLIAALLSLTFPTPTRTFLALANLLNRPLPLAFLTGDPTSIQKAYTLTLSLLSTKLPRLHAHLFSRASPDPSAHSSSSGLSLSPNEVFEPMMRTLFLAPSQGLGVEIASRVWDVMMLDGDTVVVRTTVAVLAALESRLYGSRDEVLGILGWSGSAGLNVGAAEEFMGRVRSAGKEERVDVRDALKQ